MDFVPIGFIEEVFSTYLFSALVQLVRMPACHAGGHEFESRTYCIKFAMLAQMVRVPGVTRVDIGSKPIHSTNKKLKCLRNSVGRVSHFYTE